MTRTMTGHIAMAAAVVLALLAASPRAGAQTLIARTEKRLDAERDAALDARSVESLVKDLSSPSMHVRSLAARALGRKKAEAAPAVLAALGHAEWHVRRAASEAVKAMFSRKGAKGPGSEAEREEVHEKLAPAVAKLTKLLSDKEPWVRAGAAEALGAMGKRAGAAADALARAAADDDQFVRTLALPALRAVTEDRATLLRAATALLMKRSSGFADTRHAVAVLKKHGDGYREAIPALAFFIANSGEGMWASVTPAIELMMKLDPDPAVAVPALATVVREGRYGRIRGNPREAALKALESLGTRAAGAVPALDEAIAARSTAKENKDKGLGARARKVKKTILGRPVRVYILAGQSNMEGPGSADHIKEHHPELVEPRDDVWCFFHKKKIGPLEPGFGSHGFGPELLFGHIVGDALDQYVVMVKSATGGTTQHVHWRSPSAVKRAGGEVGPLYRRLLRRTHDTLAHLDEVFPHGKGLGYELAGVLWLQGENDSCGRDKEKDVGLWTYYRENFFDFIRDLRADLGVPDLPFIIGEINDCGVWDGTPEKPKGGPTIRAAQQEAAKRLKNVYVFETKDLASGYHYDSPSHVEIGRRYAKAALAIRDLVPEQGPEAVERARKRFMATYHPRPNTSPDVSSLARGLIGYWKFDEEGGTAARDSSPSAYHGKVSGKGTRVDGLFGKAVRLTGNDRVEFPGFKDPLGPGGQIESLGVAYWIRTPVARGYNRIGKSEGHPWVKGGPTWRYEWDLSEHANERGWDVTNCDHTGLAHFTAFIQGAGVKGGDVTVARSSGGRDARMAGDGYEWHHVAASYDGAERTMRAYVDGRPASKIAEDLPGGIVPAPAAVLTIGGHLEGERNFQIWDEVAIWKRPITADEVERLFNEGYGVEIPVQ